MKPIYVAIVGSRLYDIAKEDSSDFDIKGCGFSEIDEYCGLKNKEQEDYSNNKTGKDSFNGTIYEVRRCFQLLLKGNPTVIEPFCADSKYIIHSTDIGETIAKFVRENMITKHFFKPYYFYHQDQIREFTNSNRTGKRKEEYEKYGYDGKFGGHSYRLAKQCVMIMKTGKLNPTLEGTDKDIIMKMRNHEYSKEEVLEVLNGNIQEMNNAFASSTLPEKPDFNKVNDFVTSVVKEYIYSDYEYTLDSLLGYKEFDINKFPVALFEKYR